jgi:hypothetical protein
MAQQWDNFRLHRESAWALALAAFAAVGVCLNHHP